MSILTLLITESMSNQKFIRGKGPVTTPIPTPNPHPKTFTMNCQQDQSPAVSMQMSIVALSSGQFSALKVALRSPSPYLLTLTFFSAPLPLPSQILRNETVNVLLKNKHSTVTHSQHLEQSGVSSFIHHSLERDSSD